MSVCVPPTSLTGRTALVTGASHGIGRAVALRLACSGAAVVLCGPDERPLLELVTEIEATGGAALAVPVDASEPRAAAIALTTAAGRLSDIGILINNAGAATTSTPLDTTDGDWIGGLELNLLSAVRFTRACLPAMIENRWGRIINVCGTTAQLADPRLGVYGASKAALLNFSRTVSAAYASDGVRCTAVIPEVILAGAPGREAIAGAGSARRDPARRAGRPEEIADAVTRLVTAAADRAAAVGLPVDDGMVPVAC